MKNVWIAGILSLIIPGGGHLYLGKVKKGIILIVLNVISIILAAVIIGIFTMLAVWIYAIVDSIRLTNIINQGRAQTKNI